jgi:DNA invertase Pin-like site-specific DNA recombinase
MCAKKKPAMLEPDMQDAVIYTRYSSHNQRDCSIEQQVADCEIFARQNNLRVVKVYADRHLSGTTDNRPQFQQMLKDASHGHWAYVICWKIDRFARNRYDSATYKFRLKKAGVRVLYAKESIPDGPEGILLESVLEGSAEYYSAALAQNIRRGMKYNAEQCKVNSGSIPFGYCKGPDGRFAIHEANAEVVREIFRKAAAGQRSEQPEAETQPGRAVEQGQLPAADERGLYRGVSFLGHPHRGRDARSHRSGHLLGGE